MRAQLDYFRSLPRSALLHELRRVTGIERLLLWEQVAYGDMYEPVRAGNDVAGRLGVSVGDVIGYVLLVDAPMGSAIGDLVNATPQNDAPYPDPFL